MSSFYATPDLTPALPVPHEYPLGLSLRAAALKYPGVSVAPYQLPVARDHALDSWPIW
jgi:hypothetical protein